MTNAIPDFSNGNKPGMGYEPLESRGQTDYLYLKWLDKLSYMFSHANGFMEFLNMSHRGFSYKMREDYILCRKM